MAGEKLVDFLDDNFFPNALECKGCVFELLGDLFLVLLHLLLEHD